MDMEWAASGVEGAVALTVSCKHTSGYGAGSFLYFVITENRKQNVLKLELSIVNCSARPTSAGRDLLFDPAHAIDYG